MKGDGNMKVDKLSNDEIVTMFGEVFDRKVAKMNDIESYDVENVERSVDNHVTLDVNVVGYAGTPTIDDFREGGIKDADTVVVDVEGSDSLTFKLDRDAIVFLSANDYRLTYVLQ